MKRSILVCSLGIAALVAGCGDSNKGPSDGGTTVVTQSLAFRFDNLAATAKPGDNLTFKLTVVDGSGNPFSGYKGTVKFESNDTTATLPANYTFTGDPQQTFNAQFMLAGKWALRATDTAGPAPTASAFIVVQGPASRLVKVSGDAQTGAAGAKLPKQLVVQALDDGGNPVAGVSVKWSTMMGGGSVSPATATTGADGRRRGRCDAGPEWNVVHVPGRRRQPRRLAGRIHVAARTVQVRLHRPDGGQVAPGEEQRQHRNDGGARSGGRPDGAHRVRRPASTCRSMTAR